MGPTVAELLAALPQDEPSAQPSAELSAEPSLRHRRDSSRAHRRAVRAVGPAFRGAAGSVGPTLDPRGFASEVGPGLRGLLHPHLVSLPQAPDAGPHRNQSTRREYARSKRWGTCQAPS